MLVDFSHNFTENTGVDSDYNPVRSIYSVADRNIVLSANYQSRIENAFSKSRYKFSLHILDCNINNKFLDMSRQIQIASRSVKGSSIKKHKDVITVLYSNNISGFRIPLTPWILAHRIHHAKVFTFNDNANTIFQFGDIAEINFDIRNIITDIFDYCIDGYNKSTHVKFDRRYNSSILHRFFIELLTMRSARDGYLNIGDIQAELLAQHIINGKIMLNRFNDINFDRFYKDHSNNMYPVIAKHRVSIDSLIEKLELMLDQLCTHSLDLIVGKKIIL